MTNQNQSHLHAVEDLAPAVLRWLIATNAEARARRIHSRAVSARRSRVGRGKRQTFQSYFWQGGNGK